MFGENPETEALQGSPEADVALGYAPETPDEEGTPEGPETEQAGHPSDSDQPAPTSDEPSDSDDDGERLFGGKYKTVEELEEGYRNLQALYGRQTQEVNAARQEAQIIEYLRAQGYQIPVPDNTPMPGQYGNAQVPMAPVQPGPFGVQTPQSWGTPVPQQQMVGQPQPQQPQQTEQQTEVDPVEWMDRFYQEGPKVIQEMLNQELERQGAILGQSLQQMLQPVVSTTQQLQRQQEVTAWKERLDSQVEKLKSNDDFEELVPEMRALLQRNPAILYSVDPQGNPNGLEAAYQIAKMARQQQQGSNSNTPEKKKAARLPSSGGARAPKRDDNEALVDELLGTTSSGGGIFG